MIEQILRRLTNQQNQSLDDIIAGSIQSLVKNVRLKSSEKIKNIITEGKVIEEKISDKLVELGFSDDVARELAECTKNVKKDIITRLPKDIPFLKTLLHFLIPNVYKGLCIFLDEFESMETKSAKVEMLDMLRTLHDEGDHFQSVFMLVLTRGVFWEKVKEICLPLHQRWNHSKSLSLGELSKDDIRELFLRLLEVYNKSGHSTKHLNTDEVTHEVNEIYDGLNALGLPRTFREVITVSIEKIERNWVLA